MKARKIDAMHERYGTYHALCRDCDHCITGKYHGRRISKCELYGDTRSEATDWKQSYVACGMFNADLSYEQFVPVIKQIRHASRKCPVAQIDGQVRIEIP